MKLISALLLVIVGVVPVIAVLTPALAAPLPAGKPSGASVSGTNTYVMAGAVKVARPNDRWTFEVDAKDPSAVTMNNKDAGLQVILRWVDNKAELDSRSVAATLESRLMRAPSAVGKNFSVPRKRTIGGQPGSTFLIDTQLSDAVTHRTSFYVVSQGRKCLVVAVSGGTEWLDQHRKELDAVLDSIAFVH